MTHARRFAPAAWSLSLVATGWLTACGAAPAQPTAATLAPAATAQAAGFSGNIKQHKAMASRFLKAKRDVWVYLPPGYEAAAKAKGVAPHYPVLYMHDGNNIFDGSQAFGGHEWGVDETCQKLIASGELPPMIVVGVSNTSDRMDEYTWVAGTLDGQKVGGEGRDYARFLVEELKPFIDKTYRTKPDRANTGVMGSSLGGLESLYLGRYYGQTFGKIGAMSPSIWWSDRALLKEIAQMPRDLQIYLDMGAKEGNTPDEELQNARDLERALEGRGYKPGANLDYVEDAEGGHNEQAWAWRTPGALKYLFGASARKGR